MSSSGTTVDLTDSSTSDLSELETDSDAVETDSDLEELYASFDFEDDTSQVSCTQRAENPRGNPEALLYPGAQLSPIQSRLLIFQYAIRHSLTTKDLQNCSSFSLSMFPKELLYLSLYTDWKPYFLRRSLRQRQTNISIAAVAKGLSHQQEIRGVQEMDAVVDAQWCLLPFP